MTSVLHLVSDTDRRGAQTFAVQLCAELQLRGVDGRVVALERGSSVNGHDLPVVGGSATWADRSTLNRLRLLSREHDVSIGHGSTTLPALATVRLMGGGPFVYRSIGDPSYWGIGLSRRVRTGGALLLADHVVSLYEAARRSTHEQYRVPMRRIEVIPNGVADHFRPPSLEERRDSRVALGLCDGPWAAFVGSLTPEKDPLLSVQVAAECKLGLVVAGDGRLRSEVREEAARRAVPLAMLGSVDDVRSVYWAAQVLLLTSHTEGQPAVLAEASYSGCPVVATDVGGVGGMVDVLGGRAVASRSVAAMAAAVGQVMHQPVGPHASDYRMPVVAKRWAELLMANS